MNNWCQGTRSQSSRFDRLRSQRSPFLYPYTINYQDKRHGIVYYYAAFYWMLEVPQGFKSQDYFIILSEKLKPSLLYPVLSLFIFQSLTPASVLISLWCTSWFRVLSLLVSVCTQSMNTNHSLWQYHLWVNFPLTDQDLTVTVLWRRPLA